MRRLIIIPITLLVLSGTGCGGEPGRTNPDTALPGTNTRQPSAADGGARWCDAIRAVNQAYADQGKLLASTAAEGSTPSDEDSEAAANATRHAVANALTAAPSQIKADLQLFYDALLTSVNDLEHGNIDNMQDPFESEPVTDAAIRTSAYLTANRCDARISIG